MQRDGVIRAGDSAASVGRGLAPGARSRYADAQWPRVDRHGSTGAGEASVDAVVVVRLVDTANHRRRRDLIARNDVAAGDAESQLEQTYRHSERLAVYGSLAPGRSNHHVLAPFGGTWTRGRVRGDLVELGWGAAAGYPALRLRVDGPWVLVHVLESTRLPGAWTGIDAFEGSEYRRVLVPVYAEGGDAVRIITVANLYEIAF